MSKLCMGTYLMVLYKMRASGCKQKELIGSIMHSRYSQFNEEDNSQMSHIIHGEINPPNEVRQNINWMTDEDYVELEDYFKTDVVSLLNPNRFQVIRLALTKIILEDESIEEDTVVNVISKTTKGELQEYHSSLERFLAGIFLYVLQFTDNTKSRKYVEQINKEFFDNLNVVKSKKSRSVLSNSHAQGDLQKAKEFCIKYEEEIELLPLCQIAVNIDPLHKFVREMYNAFNLCDEGTQALILELKKQRKLEFDDDDWRYSALEEYREKLKEYKLSKGEFFYDGGKYFHRAYDRYADYHIENNDPYVFKRLCESKMVKAIVPDLKSSIGFYINDYFWMRDNQPRKRPKPPLDYMWDFLGLRGAPESDVTFWMCRFIIDTCGYFVPTVNYSAEGYEYDEMDLQNVGLGDSEGLLNTLEDMYLYALLELYKFYYAEERSIR